MAFSPEEYRNMLIDMYKSATHSAETNRDLYGKIAEQYEEVFLANGCSLHLKLSAACVSQLPADTKGLIALDIAAGSGLSGKALRDSGFEGFIDAIDGCKEMLDAGKDKDVYRNVTIQLITKDHLLPYSDNTYDVVLCCGALGLGHLPDESLQDMVRVLKPGGLLVFNTCHMYNDAHNHVMPNIRRSMKQLVKEGKCELSREVGDIENFTVDVKEILQCTHVHSYKKI